MVAFCLLVLAWGVQMNAQTNKGISGSDYSSWGNIWIYPVLIFFLLVAYAVWLGPTRVLKYLAVGIFSVLFLYQFRSATALAYQHPDVPIEMATYVQTSPDVTRSVKELADYSDFATGGKNLKVIYDSFASWPYEWYLRDYKNKQFIGTGDPPTGPDVPVLFLEYARHNSDAKLVDYLPQRYALRWWFPEEWYKSDFIQGQNYHTDPFMGQVGAALSTVGGTITNPQMTATLWNYLIFRQPPKPLGSEDMIVFVRRDIAQIYHYLQYKPPTTTDVGSPTVRQPPSGGQ
jgi:hypothetical protein